MGANEAVQVAELWGEYFNSGDIEGLLSLYEDDAVVPWEGESIKGRDGIRQFLQGFLDTGGKIRFNSSVAFQHGDLALAHNSWKLEGVDQPLEGLTAEILRKQPDGTWKYVVDNPVGAAVLSP